MPVFHDVLIGVLTLGLLVVIIGEILQFKSIKKGEGRISPLIFWGVLVEVLSAAGLLTMVLLFAETVDPVKFTIQSALMLIVLVLTLVFWRREPVPAWVFVGIGGVSLACYIYSSF